MRSIFVFAFLMLGMVGAFASDRHAKISIEGTDFKYPLPNDWCDVTETENGIYLLAYLQTVIDESEVDLNVRLILRPCSTNNSGYPWSYVGLSKGGVYGSNQFVFNQMTKATLKLGLLDDTLDKAQKAQSEVAKEYFEKEVKHKVSFSSSKMNTISSDEYSLTFSNKTTSFVNDSEVNELAITSLTVAKNQIIGTYLYNDSHSESANEEHIQMILDNAKKIATLNR